MDTMYHGVQAHAAEIVKKASQIADTEPDTDIAAYARSVQLDAGTIAEDRKADSEILFKTAELVKTAGKMTAKGPANSGTLESIGAIQGHAGEIVSSMGVVAQTRERWQQERRERESEEEGSDE